MQSFTAEILPSESLKRLVTRRSLIVSFFFKLDRFEDGVAAKQEEDIRKNATQNSNG